MRTLLRTVYLFLPSSWQACLASPEGLSVREHAGIANGAGYLLRNSLRLLTQTSSRCRGTLRTSRPHNAAAYSVDNRNAKQLLGCTSQKSGIGAHLVCFINKMNPPICCLYCKSENQEFGRMTERLCWTISGDSIILCRRHTPHQRLTACPCTNRSSTRPHAGTKLVLSPLFLGPQILPIMNMQPQPHRDHHFKEIAMSKANSKHLPRYRFFLLFWRGRGLRRRGGVCLSREIRKSRNLRVRFYKVIVYLPPVSSQYLANKPANFETAHTLATYTK